MENRKSVEALHIDREGSGIRTEWTAREFPLTIMLNGDQLVTVLCSPGELEALAAGFLFSEGMIRSKDEITGMTLDAERGSSGSARPGQEGRRKALHEAGPHYRLRPGDGLLQLRRSGPQEEGPIGPQGDPEEVFSLSRRFQTASELYRARMASTAAPLRHPGGPGLRRGHRQAQRRRQGPRPLPPGGIAVADRILVTSGGSPRDPLQGGGSGIPVLISKSAPTDMGVDLARELGITLIGFVRGGGMNVYAGQERIDLKQSSGIPKSSTE